MGIKNLYGTLKKVFPSVGEHVSKAKKAQSGFVPASALRPSYKYLLVDFNHLLYVRYIIFYVYKRKKIFN